MEKKISNDDYIYLLHKTAGEDPNFIEEVFNNGLRSWYDTSIHSTLAEISAEDIQKFGLESVMKNYLGNGFKV